MLCRKERKEKKKMRMMRYNFVIFTELIDIWNDWLYKMADKNITGI